MSLKLSKTNVPPYDYYSESTNLNPITTQVALDNAGGLKGSDVVSASQLEVIVDGNVFTPWFDQIEFKEERKVVVESVTEQKTDTTSSVQVGASLVTEVDTTKEISKKQKKHSFKFKNDDDYL